MYILPLPSVDTGIGGFLLLPRFDRGPFIVYICILFVYSFSALIKTEEVALLSACGRALNLLAGPCSTLAMDEVLMYLYIIGLTVNSFRLLYIFFLVLDIPFMVL